MERKDKFVLLISSIALVISLISIYLNWQGLIFSTRPYIKITPATFIDDKVFYHTEELSPKVFKLKFKYKIENIGRTPANCISINYNVGLYRIYIKSSEIKSEKFKKIVKEGIKTGVADLERISPEEAMEEEVIKEELKELKNKDISFAKMSLKPKKLSLFPNGFYEYEATVLVLGEDAAWFIKKIKNQKYFTIESEILYWGIFPGLGRAYKTIYKAKIDNGRILPYETEAR